MLRQLCMMSRSIYSQDEAETAAAPGCHTGLSVLDNHASLRAHLQSARVAIERSFAMPLAAAGFKDVKVVARFPTDGNSVPSYIDLSTPYEQAIKEAERRRAAEGQK